MANEFFDDKNDIDMIDIEVGEAPPSERENGAPSGSSDARADAPADVSADADTLSGEPKPSKPVLGFDSLDEEIPPLRKRADREADARSVRLRPGAKNRLPKEPGESGAASSVAQAPGATGRRASSSELEFMGSFDEVRSNPRDMGRRQAERNYANAGNAGMGSSGNAGMAPSGRAGMTPPGGLVGAGSRAPRARGGPYAGAGESRREFASGKSGDPIGGTGAGSQNGRPRNGGPSSGRPSNGRPSNGGPSNGGSSNGRSSNGGPSGPKHGFVGFAAVAAVAIVATALLLFFVFGESLGFGVSNRRIDQYANGEIRLAMGADFVTPSHPPIVRDNEIALDFDTVREHIDPNISWDEPSGKVTVTTRDRLIRMNTDSLTTFVNDKATTLDLPAFEEAGVVYVPMKFLSSFYQIEVSYIEERPLVIVDDHSAVGLSASVIADGAVIREGRDRSSPVVKEYDAPAAPAATTTADMYVFEQFDGWHKVRSTDGYIGYIESRFVSTRLLVDGDAVASSSGRAAWKPIVGKIGMVWEQNISATQEPSEIGKIPGLDVVSPAWLTIEDRDGTVTNSVNARHIEWAHANGLRVWAKLGNDYSDIDKTSFFLNSQQARENAIRSILIHCVTMGLDGVNIDIENVYLDDKDALTQFARELAPMLRDQGLDVSMCVGVPDGSETWSLCYDTPALAEAVDYITLMAYDQHVPSGPVAGSAAQYSWVEQKLARLIDHYGVSADKLILGIPFYSRVWEMEDGEERGGAFVRSSALYMTTAINNVWKYDGYYEWDEQSGQFYCEYAHDGSEFQLWLEDPQSVELKLSLVHKYGLAGAAAWSREFAIQGAWEAFDNSLKQTVTYAQWQASQAASGAPKFPQEIAVAADEDEDKQ